MKKPSAPQVQAPIEPHWVYTVTLPFFPDWTKIGRTKELCSREKSYKDHLPIRDDIKLKPAIKLPSLEEAHLIEQASIKQLS